MRHQVVELCFVSILDFCESFDITYDAIRNAYLILVVRKIVEYTRTVLRSIMYCFVFFPLEV